MKNVIFDLGAVLVEWNPNAIASQFTDDVDLQQRVVNEIYLHRVWADFDQGLADEAETLKNMSQVLAIDAAQAHRLLQLTKDSLNLIPRTVEVMQQCKKQQLGVYCLSNISPSFLSHLQGLHDFFDMFDGIVTSGAEHTAKPEAEIFEILLQRYELDPQHCLFIDDSSANTSTARSFNINTVTFQGSSDCYARISQWLDNVHPQ